MATKVFNEEEITLQDGTEVTLRPLPIGRLRRFMDAWAKFGDVTDDDEGFNVFVNCAGISLENDFKGKFDALKATDADKKKGEYLSAEYKAHLEEILDLDTIYKILDVCGGLKLQADPKVIEAAANLADEEARGKN